MQTETKTAFAFVAALALVVTGIAGPAAAETEAPDELENPVKDFQTEPTCYELYRQIQAGPVTFTMYSSCEGDVEIDEDWRPGLSTLSGHTDNPVKCFLNADTPAEEWSCFFGPPGP